MRQRLQAERSTRIVQGWQTAVEKFAQIVCEFDEGSTLGLVAGWREAAPEWRSARQRQDTDVDSQSHSGLTQLLASDKDAEQHVQADHKIGALRREFG